MAAMVVRAAMRWS